jgi:hypothetical protein
VNPGLSRRTGRSGRHADGCHEAPGPGRRIVSRTAREGVSRFGGQAGLRLPNLRETAEAGPGRKLYPHPPCRLRAGCCGEFPALDKAQNGRFWKSWVSSRGSAKVVPPGRRPVLAADQGVQAWRVVVVQVPARGFQAATRGAGRPAAAPFGGRRNVLATWSELTDRPHSTYSDNT